MTTTLTSQQITRLSGLMDARFARELEEIDAITARAHHERSQERLAGRPAEQLDAAISEIAGAADFAMVRQNVQDVRDIIAARKRMAAGTYGACIACGEAVAFERLLAYPTAKRCIECQRGYEAQKAIREGRRGP